MDAQGASGGVSVARFCLVERQETAVLAAVTTLVGKMGINIVGNSSRLRGSLNFQVLDVQVPSAGRREVENALVSELLKVPGVVQCTLGAFSRESGEMYVDNAPVRLCIVAENVPGTLGQIAQLLGVELGLRVVGQTNRGRGSLAYNVFDVENNGMTNWSSVCEQLESLKAVVSCSLGHFVNVPFGKRHSNSSSMSVTSGLSIDEREEQSEVEDDASREISPLMPPTADPFRALESFDAAMRSTPSLLPVSTSGKRKNALPVSRPWRGHPAPPCLAGLARERRENLDKPKP